MTEIIPTIFAGIPYLLLAFVFVALVYLYFLLLEWAWDSRRDWLVLFLILIPFALFLSIILYFIGGMI